MCIMTGIRNSNVTTITFKNADGTVAGSLSFTKASQKKKKRLQYNFKEISSMLLTAKTSGSADQALIKARVNVAMLQRKLRNGDYDEKELQNALTHAKKLEQIARKRKKHLKEEEKAAQQGSCQTDAEQYEDSDTGKTAEEQNPEVSQEALEDLMRQFRQFTEETLDELADAAGLDELADAFMEVSQTDMDEEDLQRLKRKHRAEELQEITEADMKYLKNLFNKLEREKRQAGSAVSLELSGTEIPAQITETPVLTEGGSVDLSV